MIYESSIQCTKSDSCLITMHQCVNIPVHKPLNKHLWLQFCYAICTYSKRDMFYFYQHTVKTCRQLRNNVNVNVNAVKQHRCQQYSRHRNTHTGARQCLLSFRSQIVNNSSPMVSHRPVTHIHTFYYYYY